ncbi:MAG: TIGR04086 family membrane protein [Christensenellaceae bacterium]|nr:TIGR04086 family membrane protein [Christensenellaceae bacterium]
MAKKKNNRNSNHSRKNAVTAAIRASFYGLIFTIAMILAFALILKETRLGGEIISLVDQGIKMISIFLSAYLAAKNSAEDMIPNGIIAGTLYIVLGYFSFSLIEGCFGDIKKLFLDLLMGAAIGLITALICRKTKKKSLKRT